MSQDSYSSWCYGRPINPGNKSEEEFESRINIITPVNIWQIGAANGGDANGGDGGSAIGGAAAAAFAEAEGDGDAIAPAIVAVNRRTEYDSNGAGVFQAVEPDQPVAANRTAAANQALRTEKASAGDQADAADAADQALDGLDLAASLVLQGEGATAIGGDATGGNGGNGGAGGAGGSVTNTAVVTNVNVLVFSSDETVNTPALTIGTGNGRLDISSDETGTFVNGEKMDETVLDNGTKVFIFRNSEVKK